MLNFSSRSVAFISFVDGEYLYLPPNRYAFPGAEIYSEGESEEEDYFRNSMSGSSTSSSLFSQDNYEQTMEEIESLEEQQESSEDSEDREEKDILEVTGEERISNSDSDNHGEVVPQTLEIQTDKTVSCEPDSRQENERQLCVEKADSRSNQAESKLPIDTKGTQSLDGDAPLPDSSNSNI
jgi:hypothetical protein